MIFIDINGVFLSVLVQWEVIVHFKFTQTKVLIFFVTHIHECASKWTTALYTKLHAVYHITFIYFLRTRTKLSVVQTTTPSFVKKNHCMENKCAIILCKEDMGFETTMTKYVRLLRFGYTGIFLPPKYYNYH